MAVFEFASFWGVRLQKLAKIDFQDLLEEAASIFPTDARLLKLLNRAREILVRLAKGAGIKLHQFYHRVGKFALIKHQRYQAIQARQQGLILAASFAKSRVAMKK